MFPEPGRLNCPVALPDSGRQTGRMFPGPEPPWMCPDQASRSPGRVQPRMFPDRARLHWRALPGQGAEPGWHLLPGRFGPKQQAD